MNNNFYTIYYDTTNKKKIPLQDLDSFLCRWDFSDDHTLFFTPGQNGSNPDGQVTSSSNYDARAAEGEGEGEEIDEGDMGR